MQICCILMGMIPASALANTNAFWYKHSFLQRMAVTYAQDPDSVQEVSAVVHHAECTQRYNDNIIYMKGSHCLVDQDLGSLLLNTRAIGGSDSIDLLDLMTSRAIW